MDKYIAAKPVRFDRNYAAGEIIPDGVIDPRSVKRLRDTGSIALAPSDGLLDINTQADGQNMRGEARGGAEAPPEKPADTQETADAQNLVCPVCGKKCGSKSALTSHMKTHAAE